MRISHTVAMRADRNGNMQNDGKLVDGNFEDNVISKRVYNRLTFAMYMLLALNVFLILGAIVNMIIFMYDTTYGNNPVFGLIELLVQIEVLLQAICFGFTSYLIMKKMKKHFPNFYHEYKCLLIFVEVGFTFSLLARGILKMYHLIARMQNDSKNIDDLLPFKINTDLKVWDKSVILLLFFANIF